MSLDLFQLLPAVYRTRDAQIAASQTLLSAAQQTQLDQLLALDQPDPQQQAELAELQALASRGPLQSLLMLIGQQFDVVAYDLDQLYDDQFIETCAPWVIPYIGDLIGYRSVKGIAPSVDNPRSEVAETISLRRRKGTALVIEQLARDVTGWGAHAVEEFKLLAETQYMKCVRPHSVYAPDARNWKNRVYLNTGFDATAHRVDVRRIASGRGRYNVQNIGIFLWTLSANGITRCPVTPSAAGNCFRFHPLGMDVPLFHRATSQGERIEAAAAESNVPDALLNRVLCSDLQQGVGASYYGEGASLALYRDGQLLSPYQIAVADLSGDDGHWANLPSAKSPYLAVVDPENGRIALSPSAAGEVFTASWYYGFNGNLGGGEYARNTSSSPFVVTDPAFVVAYPAPGVVSLQAAIANALTLLTVDGAVAVEISGGLANGLYPCGSCAHPISGALHIDLPPGATFELRSADRSVQTLLLDAPLTIGGDADSNFYLNGLVLAASSKLTPSTATPALLCCPAQRTGSAGGANALAQLVVNDCTVLPGWSVATDGTPLQATAPAVQIAAPAVGFSATASILGAIRANALATVSLTNSILDATAIANMAYSALDGNTGGGELSFTGCTVLGRVHATLLKSISNSIFWSAKTAANNASGLVADRKQQGCVRFSFLPYDAVTPPPYECVMQAEAAPTPYFEATRYGRPGYMKLLPCTDAKIRSGADNGNEMGAYNFHFATQRAGDLQIRLQEYLPVGLESGSIYQN